MSFIACMLNLYRSGYHHAALIAHCGPQFVLIPSTCLTPSTGISHPTLRSTNCSACGTSFVSCSCRSSTVPILQKLRAGKPLLRRYMSVPQMEQNELVIVLPVPIVARRTRSQFVFATDVNEGGVLDGDLRLVSANRSDCNCRSKASPYV